MRARYYSPQFGRFISRDPIGLQGGISSTAYADGNPISNNDPSGLIANSVSNTITNYAGQVNNWLSSPTSSSLLATTMPAAPSLLDALPSFDAVVTKTTNLVSPIVDSISTRIPSLVPALPAISLPGLVGTVLTAPIPGNIGQNVQDQLYGPFADPKYSPIYNNVQDNRNNGIQAENEVAADLTAAGRDASRRQVRKDTPFGTRVLDMEVRDQQGNVLGGVEVKSGNSRYRADQRSKDEWLKQNGYPVNVVRKP